MEISNRSWKKFVPLLPPLGSAPSASDEDHYLRIKAAGEAISAMKRAEPKHGTAACERCGKKVEGVPTSVLEQSRVLLLCDPCFDINKKQIAAQRKVCTCISNILGGQPHEKSCPQWVEECVQLSSRPGDRKTFDHSRVGPQKTHAVRVPCDAGVIVYSDRVVQCRGCGMLHPDHQSAAMCSRFVEKPLSEQAKKLLFA